MKPVIPVKHPDTIRWIPGSSAHRYSPSVIKAIHIHALAPAVQNPLAEPTQSLLRLTNHWTMSLQLADGTGAIHADPSPQYPSMSMLLLLSFKEHLVPPDVHKTMDFPVTRVMTVLGFLQNLQRLGLDQYDFTEEGAGCRYWVDCVLHSFYRSKLASFEDIHLPESPLDIVWQSGEPVDAHQQTDLRLRKGTFRGPTRWIEDEESDSSEGP